MLCAICLSLWQETPHPCFLRTSLVCFFLLSSALPSLNALSVLLLICKVMLLFFFKFLLHGYFICSKITVSQVSYLYVCDRYSGVLMEELKTTHVYEMHVCHQSFYCFYYGLFSCLYMTHQVTWGKAYLFLMPEVLLKSKQKYM